MVIHNTFNDFSLFLYLHIAHADGNLHQQEEAVVREKISRLFGSETDIDKKFADALDQYNSVRKEDLPLLIRSTFRHFKEVEFAAKYKVFTELFDIINADGRVDFSETSVISQMRELMTLGSEADNTEG